MRQYRRDVRHRSDNRETYYHFLMPFNRDNSFAVDLLYSMDNHAESTRRVIKLKLNKIFRSGDLNRTQTIIKWRYLAQNCLQHISLANPVMPVLDGFSCIFVRLSDWS